MLLLITEYYEEYKEAENTILSIMDKMLPNFKSGRYNKNIKFIFISLYEIINAINMYSY